MAHFAKVENGIVTSVIVIDQETLELGHWGDPALWVQTSYNTSGGQHPQGRPMRKNYAGIGYKYDEQRDAFIPPKPNGDYWVFDEEKCVWYDPEFKAIEIGVARV